MFQIQILDEVISTQDSVRDALAHGGAEGLVVSGVRQTGGRGRHGRVWEGLEGNLFASIALKPARPLAEVGSLALVIGVALARAAGSGAQLKWPNDMLINGRKCAGILCEVEGDFVIAGLGVNIKSAPDGGAVVAGTRDAAQLLDAFLAVFQPLYARWQRDGFVALKDDWLALAHPIGAQVTVKRSDQIVEGAFAGLADDGALLLRGANGAIRTVTAGELSVKA